ncbi:hypothetical protein KSF_036930 [Reticulibacter mediterranei]|uniref:Uncharacterized protein n=1 Tax=Reticulibacter mediterranei TaxID=2778369 RepID=A0A8J3IMZ3_9CHLR|nr:hypothetical protein [Reticulibacter mediterranei]GHO93645.1 hypothetical protein KSF_036930 [Reticulibacter mediterranei]
MNTQTRNRFNTALRVGRVLWKLYGLAWFAIILPVVFYTGIALCLAMGTLYVAIFGPIGGAILLLAAILTVLFRHKLAHEIAKYFDRSLKLVAFECIACCGLLLAATCLHFPLNPLWYGLASLLANTLLEGRWEVSVSTENNDDELSVYVETLFWLWFAVSWIFVLIYGIHPGHTSMSLLLISLGLVAGSFLEATRKYFFARHKKSCT